MNEIFASPYFGTRRTGWQQACQKQNMIYTRPHCSFPRHPSCPYSHHSCGTASPCSDNHTNDWTTRCTESLPHIHLQAPLRNWDNFY